MRGRAEVMESALPQAWAMHAVYCLAEGSGSSLARSSRPPQVMAC